MKSVPYIASAETIDAADEVAASFAAQLAASIDVSLGSPRFAPRVTAWQTNAPTVLDERDVSVAVAARRN